jgi:YidC/Oxa1 family membrane protein insertase
VIRNNPLPNTDAYAAWEERQRKKGRDPREIAAQKDARAKGQPRTATANGAVVERQGGSVATDTAPSNGSNGGAGTGPTAPQRPVRQQPRRQPRSQRRN